LSRQDLLNRVVARVAPNSTMVKTAAFPQQDEGPSEDVGASGPDSGKSAKRNIPKDHPFDPKSLKPMATALWATSVSLGHALTAYRHLSRLKSATISPDGMLGGRGYVMGIADVRKKLYAACEALSGITDTLHDEITAPHWKPRLAELDDNDAEDIEKFVEKSQDILEDPEEQADEEAEEIEGLNDRGKRPSKSKAPPGEESASKIPGGGSSAVQDAEPIIRTKEASSYSYGRTANSSIDPGALSGPRVEHLDRDMQQDPELVEDDWGLPGSNDEFEDTERGQGDLSNRGAGSAVPDASSDPTPTEAYDFGLGYGARGQGAGGYENPSNEGNGKGVWGPTSTLPGAPPQSSGDTTPALDSKLSQGELPGDTDSPVARADYYRGDRGNLVNAPLAQSQIPGEASPGSQVDQSMMNTDYVYQDVETPYVRYDYTTPNYRQDPLHNWPQKQQAG
jgi:hypothetical protein